MASEDKQPDEARCKTCGVLMTQHPGIYETCRERIEFQTKLEKANALIAELQAAAIAVIRRWDSKEWNWETPTAELIESLREAVQRAAESDTE